MIPYITKNNGRRNGWRAACALVLLATAASVALAQPSATSAVPPFVDLNIVAHADDDSFFMNPDLFNAILAKHTIVTVYLTSGNVEVDDYYYMHQREQGSMHEYAAMAQAAQYMNQHGLAPGATGAATAADIDTIFDPKNGNVNPDHVHWNISLKTYGPGPFRVTQADCVEYPNIHLIFMRSPSAMLIDGTAPHYSVVQLGTLAPQDQPATLKTIYNNSAITQQSVDGLTTYSKEFMTNALLEIMTRFAPTMIRTQDYVDNVVSTDDQNSGNIYYDHSDHYWGARFASDAANLYTQYLQLLNPVPLVAAGLPSPPMPQLWFYRGYGMYTGPDPTTSLSVLFPTLYQSFVEIKFWTIYFYSYYDYQMQWSLYFGPNDSQYVFPQSPTQPPTAYGLDAFKAFERSEGPELHQFAKRVF